jgi:predicted metalloprotease
MGFFQQIQAAAGSNADFARAYAISHEVGHHVQNLLGISTKVRHFQAQTGKVQANALSVKMELQADCFSGVWGHYTAQRGLITGQDIQTALNTAAQIGDDYLQKQARGYAVPESFTHGTSQQRTAWFTRGLKTGNIKQCDTFAAN